MHAVSTTRLQRAPMSRLESALKRTLDIAVAATMLVVLAPLFIFSAFAVVIDTGFPVFFRRRRLGFCGKTFSILKFRTMTVCEDGATVTQARRGDARVTSVGRLLRRSSLDELPQLINVLMGHMSLVGPRLTRSPTTFTTVHSSKAMRNARR